MNGKQTKRAARVTAPKAPKHFTWSVTKRARATQGVMPLTGCGGSDGSPIKWPT